MSIEFHAFFGGILCGLGIGSVLHAYVVNRYYRRIDTQQKEYTIDQLSPAAQNRANEWYRKTFYALYGLPPVMDFIDYKNSGGKVDEHYLFDYDGNYIRTLSK